MEVIGKVLALSLLGNGLPISSGLGGPKAGGVMGRAAARRCYLYSLPCSVG